MPVNFHIFPDRNLVLARFTGHILLADCLSSAKAYSEDPQASPQQTQLIDLSGVTSYERDLVQIMSMMARLPDHLLKPGYEPMILYIAPSRVAQEIAGMVLKSMQGIEGVIVRVLEDETQALEVLGLAERSLAALMAGA
ncbi:MAG: hypothetical protein E6Q73_11770 [Pseudorhodobacter sp.]|nr:MAG: hypothetical protein E6Q73_11770 [Pseudorhodobacter sp.]